MDHSLLDLINKRRLDPCLGICSVCSANEYVLEAAMERGVETGRAVLIEATANQVNQFGGYTGMRPADFVSFVVRIAQKTGLPSDRLILGGDHLGPLVWQTEAETGAMQKAAELVREYVLAGFTKIHIDTSMRLLGDDPNERLDDGVIARRSATLIRAAEEAFRERGLAHSGAVPVYVIGSEVPVPGGSPQNEESVLVTDVREFEAMLSVFSSVFEAEGLGDAFGRVVGVVVQPGVEFADDSLVEYDRQKARPLIDALRRYPGIVLEGHSTDYQTRVRLREMVEDGIAILKVGPALTFALREALFALADIESDVLCGSAAKLSDFKNVLEAAMLSNKGHWARYYNGSEMEKRLKRKYSFSDRCRYYLPEQSVSQATSRLIENINTHRIPLSVVDQYMPIQYRRIRNGFLRMDARELIKDHIKDCLDDYLYATGGFRSQ